MSFLLTYPQISSSHGLLTIDSQSPLTTSNVNVVNLLRKKRSPRGARLGGKVSSSLGTNNRVITRIDGKRNSSSKPYFNLLSLLMCLCLTLINT